MPRLQAPLVFVVFSLGFQALPAHTQTMYRCGQVFQDKPCASGTPSKVLGSTTSEAAATPESSQQTSLYCSGQAAKAKKIVWAREIGRTLDDMLRDASSAEEKNLISEVYARRERADLAAERITKTCLKREEEDRRNQALADALAKQYGRR